MDCSTVTLKDVSTTVNVGGCVVNVTIPYCGTSTPANPPGALANLPLYDSDEAAILGGLEVGSYYILTWVNIYGHAGGTTKQII
jgi:hypothetical protein